MKTLEVLLGVVIIGALANAACGNHVCPPWGCLPVPSTTQVAEEHNVTTATTVPSEGLLATVVTFIKDIVAEIVPARPKEAVKKKASRMGLRKSKTYMKSLGRS